MKRLLISGFFAATALSAFCGVDHLLPTPAKLEVNASNGFSLNRTLKIESPYSDPYLQRMADSLSVARSGRSGIISVELVDSIPGSRDYALYGYPDEAYSINVTPDTVFIRAVNATGVKRAAATLAQLALDSDTVAAVEIVDWPAFKLRGYLHDVGRSFISVDELKREIDLLSRFKINTFHWHLTENQAWRLAIDEFPQLTADSVTTRFPGQYYTLADCSEIDRYAAERGMIVIPEIDMPGHSKAFERAMGHSMQTDEGIAQLDIVLERVAQAFPNAPYIHIGGDEVRITYPGYLERMIRKVESLGKKTIVWNPIHGVDIATIPGVAMTQMWGTAGRLLPGVPNIDCRYNYINHFDTFADIAGIYGSNIYYANEGNPEIAGEISGCWNDRKLPDEKEIINQNNFYAAVLAAGERAWKGGGEGYIEQLGTTLTAGTERLREFADWERRFLYHKDHWLAGEPIPYVKQTQVEWNIAGPFDNGGDPQAVFPPETGELAQNYTLADGTVIDTKKAVGAGIYLRHTWGGIVPGLYGNAPLNKTAYAWTYVWAPRDMEATAYIELQNYSRSEKDLSPDAGEWDRKGSRIWINGEELEAPQWQNAGKPVDNETLLRDENASARRPYPVKLRKGWNTVMLKLPYIKAEGVRLNKWMFTFVLTDESGRKALDEVVYSADFATMQEK